MKGKKIKRFLTRQKILPIMENAGEDHTPLLSGSQHCVELLQTLNGLDNSSYEGHKVRVLGENMVAPLEVVLEKERKEMELMKNQEVDLESISNTLLQFMKDCENQLNAIRATFQRLPVPYKEVLEKSQQKLTSGADQTIQRRAEREEEARDEGNAKKAEKEMRLKEKEEKKLSQFLDKRKQEHVKRQEKTRKDECKKIKRILDEIPKQEEAELKKKMKDDKMKLEAKKKWEKGVMKTADEHRKWRETQNKIQVEEQRKQLKRSMKDQEKAQKKQEKEQKKQEKEKKEREERELKKQKTAAKQEKLRVERQKKQEHFEETYYRLLAKQTARKEMVLAKAKEREKLKKLTQKPKMRITIVKKPCFIWNLFGGEMKKEGKYEQEQMWEEAGESYWEEEEVDETLVTERDVSRRGYGSMDMTRGQSPVSFTDIGN